MLSSTRLWWLVCIKALFLGASFLDNAYKARIFRCALTQTSEKRSEVFGPFDYDSGLAGVGGECDVADQ